MTITAFFTNPLLCKTFKKAEVSVKETTEVKNISSKIKLEKMCFSVYKFDF